MECTRFKLAIESIDENENCSLLFNSGFGVQELLKMSPYKNKRYTNACFIKLLY